MDREDPLRVLLEGRPGIGKTSRAASSPCSATSDLLGRDVAVVPRCNATTTRSPTP